MRKNLKFCRTAFIGLLAATSFACDDPRPTSQPDLFLASLLQNQAKDVNTSTSKALVGEIQEVSAFQSSVTVSPNGQVTFRLKVSDEDPEGVRFFWSTVEGPIGPATKTVNGLEVESEFVWNAPACGADLAVWVVALSSTWQMVHHPYETITVSDMPHCPTVEQKISDVIKEKDNNFGRAVTVSGDYMAVSQPNYDAYGVDTGYLHFYKRQADGSFDGTLITHASFGQDYTGFGQSVAMDGIYTAAGAPLVDGDSQTDQGRVFIFKKEDDSDYWNNTGSINPPTPVNQGHFGQIVAISGNRLAASAPGMGNGGMVFVYERDTNENWALKAELSSTGSFGQALALNGDRLVVSAGANQVQVFDRDGNGVWNHTHTLSASDAQSGDEFGSAIALEGTRIAVGAANQAGSGSAYIFDFNGTNWIQSAIIRNPDPSPGDDFGRTIELLGNRILVGAPQEDGGTDNPILNAGAAFVYDLENSAWGLTLEYRASNLAAGDQMGTSLALGDGFFFAGAPNADGYLDTADDTGMLYHLRFQ